jgi:hypothetical protein
VAAITLRIRSTVVIVHRRKEIFTDGLRICRRINEGMLTS